MSAESAADSMINPLGLGGMDHVALYFREDAAALGVFQAACLVVLAVCVVAWTTSGVLEQVLAVVVFMTLIGLGTPFVAGQATLRLKRRS